MKMKCKGKICKIVQTYNPQNKAYVKMKVTDKGAKILNVKERNPKKPFKGVKIMK